MGRYAYKITPFTKAIQSYDSSFYKARVYEGNRWIKVAKTTEKILEDSCFANKSTLNGRRDYARKLLNVTYKVPIPIIPHLGVFMFPIITKRNKQCYWIALDLIERYEKLEPDTVRIQFRDGTFLHLDTSLDTFQKQYQRTAQLKIMMNRPSYYDELDPLFD
ncbi:Competence transcription factor [Lentibacillus sp. JNUCC-1]|uniref:competence protein ComK n=1 Tax=Lentibacillus sp. JNUCC-1 TaxID=2654513 RepID=UPI0012E95E41|nr:competence protein ComK [Lentibacillus sp. JNUCC-1]MUV37357.1 Competence transcription factor [Lentibacillus sp. JNUCC-1]